jgi:hypothetical protein
MYYMHNYHSYRCQYQWDIIINSLNGVTQGKSKHLGRELKSLASTGDGFPARVGPKKVLSKKKKKAHPIPLPVQGPCLQTQCLAFRILHDLALKTQTVLVVPGNFH